MNMDKLFEGLEKRAGRVVNEAMESAAEAVKAPGWFYVPKKTYVGGLMKPIVHEISSDKWEILFCAPQTSASAEAEAGGKELMATEEIRRFQDLLILEEVEGDKASLSKWYVKAKWAGKFEDTLKKCVSIVEGETTAIPSSFKQKK